MDRTEPRQFSPSRAENLEIPRRHPRGRAAPPRIFAATAVNFADVFTRAMRRSIKYREGEERRDTRAPSFHIDARRDTR